MKEMQYPLWVQALTPPRVVRSAPNTIPVLLHIQQSCVADSNYFRHLFDELALAIPQSDAAIERWSKTAHQAVDLFTDCARRLRASYLVPRAEISDTVQ